METMLPKITDYWDQQVEAISTMAGRLAALNSDARERALNGFVSAIARHVEAIPEPLLVSVAVVVADDLYKAACWIDRWDDSVNAYLSATAGQFWTLIADRGYTVRYLVDNTFETWERPLQLFPAWFAAANFVYVCPQAIAADLIKADGGSDTTLKEQLPRYVAEARAVTEKVLARCRTEGRHYILLDLDYDERTLQSSLAERGRPGVITVFRNQAAEPGTTVALWAPER